MGTGAGGGLLRVAQRAVDAVFNARARLAHAAEPDSPSVRTADHTLLVKEHVLEVGKLTQVGAPCHKWVTLTLTSGQVIAGHTCQMVKAKGQPRLRE